ncbi:hypothetical protein HYALB_00002152 [Hymenoscyphus albidus]|uniref:Uncharacterized protein n=1 Tax=Hymenoscyphus albidus TaxID=595503 RepID=A0A9N9Q7F1_9HELO|nr:hypothetical protein HYALB_00002152 [Hymenoscyphus albidus]
MGGINYYNHTPGTGGHSTAPVANAVPTAEAVPQGTTIDNTEPEIIRPNVPPLARRLLEDRNDFNVDHETQLKRWMHAHKNVLRQAPGGLWVQTSRLVTRPNERALRHITMDKMGTCFRQMQRKGAAWEEPDPLRPIQKLVRYADWCVTWNDPKWDGRVEKPAGWDGNGEKRVGGNENVERPAGWVVIVKTVGWANSPEHSVANEDESEDEHASERKDIDIEETQKRDD